MNDSGGTARRSDSKQLARQWAILRLLADSGREFTVKELADQLGSTKSTIQRDLATLEQEFALVEEQVGVQKKAYRIDQSIRALDTIRFGTAELLALHAAASAIESLVGTPLHGDLRAVKSKIRGFLSPRHNGGLDALARVFQPHPRGYVDYGDHGEVIDSLADAIARRRVCEVVYHSTWRGTTRTHRVRPLRLVWHRSAMYLLGQVEGKTEITTFAVHRVQKLDVTADDFPAPRVNIADHARRAFGIFVSDDEEDVEILFAEEIAWRIEERTFHPDEQKQRLDDGRLQYRLRSSAQWEIIPWVQTFGPLAELVSPASWREAIRENAEATGALYNRGRT